MAQSCRSVSMNEGEEKSSECACVAQKPNSIDVSGNGSSVSPDVRAFPHPVPYISHLIRPMTLRISRTIHQRPTGNGEGVIQSRGWWLIVVKAGAHEFGMDKSV